MKVGNPNNLIEVETCYDLRRLNQAIKAGQPYSIVPVKKNSELERQSLLLRHKATDEVVLVESRTVLAQHRGRIEYTHDEWEEIEVVKGYARTRERHEGWGAYILPSYIRPDDRVYIADLIEDIVATTFWSNVYAATDGEGVWDGERIRLDMKPYQRLTMVG